MHVHCYRSYPETFVGCINDERPPLAVGDSVEYKGENYEALPMWKGTHLLVRRDSHRAQVATPIPREPAGRDLGARETGGAGVGGAGQPQVEPA